MAGIDRIRAERLGGQVFLARDRACLSQYDLARKIGITPQEVSQLENGSHPRIQDLAPQALTALLRQRLPRHLN